MNGKKIFTIEMSYDKDGKSTMERVNDGFSALELLGVLELTQKEILQQMEGSIKPDIIKRKVIK